LLNLSSTLAGSAALSTKIRPYTRCTRAGPVSFNARLMLPINRFSNAGRFLPFKPISP